MKNYNALFHGAFLFSLLILFTGCMKDKCERSVTYTRFDPIYMSYEELRNSVASEAPRSLENPGKIYFKDQYIFVNEVDKGVHVINNIDPSNPQNIAFIKIPGNIDLAVKGNTLYADSYIDLLAIDISDPANTNITKRIENILPYRTYNTYAPDPAKGVVVDWTSQVVTEVLSCDVQPTGGWIVMEDNTFNNQGVTNTMTGSGGGSRSGAPSAGIGGSMARFALAGQRLYTVDNEKMKLFDVNFSPDPQYIKEVNIGMGIETIFPYMNNLFIGSTTGMFIYDISNNGDPEQLSSITHVTSCDPVVAEGDFAYVTLRSGTDCFGNINELQIFNIQNKRNPSYVTQVSMVNPHGLAVRDNTLFVCDGESGLKIYDVDHPQQTGQNLIKHIQGMKAYDVIALNQILLLISENGLYQYNYADLNNIYEMSMIPVVRN